MPEDSTQVPPAAAPAQVSPPAAAAPPASAPAGEPDWLPGRIAQAKKNQEADTLKALGVSNVDEAKAAIAAAKAAAETKKSAEEKAAELKTQLDAQASRNASLETAIKARASGELAGLTEAQKAAVMAVAGEDAAAQLRAIDSLKPTWAAAPAAPATQAPAQQPKPPPAANTAPTREAPGSAPTDGTNHAAVYENLKQSNPFAAAQYRQTNRAALAQAESKKT